MKKLLTKLFFIYRPVLVNETGFEGVRILINLKKLKLVNHANNVMEGITIKRPGESKFFFTLNPVRSCLKPFAKKNKNNENRKYF